MERMMAACDISEQWAATVRDYWREAGVGSKIDLRLAPAAESLEALVHEAGQRGVYELAFIDADKESYDRYYEYCLELIRPNGLILLDNAFWHGSVADGRSADKEASPSSPSQPKNSR